MTSEALLKHAQALEDIAYATPRRNRLMGTKGHNDTVTYLYQQLTAPELRGYYNVTLQPWQGVVQLSAEGSLFLDKTNTSIVVAEFSPSGKFSAPLAVAGNLGCNAVSSFIFLWLKFFFC